MSRFTKIGLDHQRLQADATGWVAVFDNTTGLMWNVSESEEMTQPEAEAYAAKLTIAGFNDWRLPTVDELFALADRTKYRPAIDAALFPDCKSDWYWTASPAAYSPSVYAWLVSFYYGSAGWYDRGYGGYVRAVRAGQ